MYPSVSRAIRHPEQRRALADAQKSIVKTVRPTRGKKYNRSFKSIPWRVSWWLSISPGNHATACLSDFTLHDAAPRLDICLLTVTFVYFTRCAATLSVIWGQRLREPRLGRASKLTSAVSHMHSTSLFAARTLTTSMHSACTWSSTLHRS